MAKNRFTPDVIDRLLDKLGSDDAFRAQVMSDPKAAFASLGVDVDPAEMPKLHALPSKEQIQADRAALSQRMASQTGLGIFLAL